MHLNSYKVTTLFQDGTEILVDNVIPGLIRDLNEFGAIWRFSPYL
jgi:hypothetical protein